MNKIVLSSIVAVAGIAASAQAQYTFEMRMVADGMEGAPTPSAVHPNNWAAYPIGDVNNVTVSRIGFWLQARVSQTSGENWGVVRGTSPTGGTSASFITVSDPVGASSMSRGQVGNQGTAQNPTPIYGRGVGYRSGGTPSGSTGNVSGSVPFPGSTGNLNGGLDNNGSGVNMTRLYAFDAFVGGTRNGDGDPSNNPWNVNGAPGQGDPYPLGQFSDWNNMVHIWIDVGSLDTVRTVTLNALALLNGALLAEPTDDSATSWAMRIAVNNGSVQTAAFSFRVAPTPGAAAMLGLGGLAAMRRRR